MPLLTWCLRYRRPWNLRWCQRNRCFGLRSFLSISIPPLWSAHRPDRSCKEAFYLKCYLYYLCQCVMPIKNRNTNPMEGFFSKRTLPDPRSLQKAMSLVKQVWFYDFLHQILNLPQTRCMLGALIRIQYTVLPHTLRALSITFVHLLNFVL